MSFLAAIDEEEQPHGTRANKGKYLKISSNRGHCRWQNMLRFKGYAGADMLMPEQQLVVGEDLVETPGKYNFF